MLILDIKSYAIQIGVKRKYIYKQTIQIYLSGEVRHRSGIAVDETTHINLWAIYITQNFAIIYIKKTVIGYGHSTAYKNKRLYREKCGVIVCRYQQRINKYKQNAMNNKTLKKYVFEMVLIICI